jgi:hypothetical protein
MANCCTKETPMRILYLVGAALLFVDYLIVAFDLLFGTRSYPIGYMILLWLGMLLCMRWAKEEGRNGR